MKILFNNNISSISVFEKSRYYGSFIVKNGRRKIGTRFGIFPVYEKIYGIFGRYSEGFLYTIEDFNKGTKYYVEENDGIYYRPYCNISMNNGNTESIYFSTVSELKDYIEKIKEKSNHIIIK
jgi:hypothetical protein